MDYTLLCSLCTKWLITQQKVTTHRKCALYGIRMLGESYTVESTWCGLMLQVNTCSCNCCLHWCKKQVLHVSTGIYNYVHVCIRTCTYMYMYMYTYIHVHKPLVSFENWLGGHNMKFQNFVRANIFQCIHTNRVLTCTCKCSYKIYVMINFTGGMR